jgi:hypothetical protein
MNEQNRFPVSDEDVKEEKANESKVFWTLAASFGVWAIAQHPQVNAYFKDNQNIILGVAGAAMGATMGVLGYNIYRATRKQEPHL